MAPKKRQDYSSFHSGLAQLFEKIDKMQDSLSCLDKKFDLYAQKTQYELEKIHELDSEQNAILSEHQQRSQELKKDNELREASLRHEMGQIDVRVQALEAPRKWWTITKKKLLGVVSVLTAIGGMIYAILQIFIK